MVKDLKSVLCCANESAAAPTLILGLGNPLCGDDGLGSRSVELLSGADLPVGVTIREAGLPGWELPAWLEGWPRVILIDAAQMGLPPGSWRRFGLQDVRLVADRSLLSLHDAGLADGLALAEALGVLPPEIAFFCLQPENVDPGRGLSPAVSSALPGMVAEILNELWKRDQ